MTCCRGFCETNAVQSPSGCVSTRLTDTCGDCGAPRFVVLAGCGFLALQAEPGGAEELTAGVEVGAV